MAKSYSMDLRTRLVEAVDGGESRREAARRFGVSASCAVKLIAHLRSTGSAEPGRRGRRSGGGKLGPFRAMLLRWVEETPDVTMTMDTELLVFVRIDWVSTEHQVCLTGTGEPV